MVKIVVLNDNRCDDSSFRCEHGISDIVCQEFVNQIPDKAHIIKTGASYEFPDREHSAKKDEGYEIDS